MKVQEALAKKNELLRSIKREAEIAVLEYKKTLEADYQRQLTEVSRNLLLIAFADQSKDRPGLAAG